MRRMYSEQELTKVIKAVFEQELEDGALDENVADAVDAYLVENPVDITALEGQDVELNSLDATALITGGEIVEKMSGYSFTPTTSTEQFTINVVYAGICKNGNKLTYVIFASIKRLASVTGDNIPLGRFTIPASVGSKLYPYTISGISNVLMNRLENLASGYTAYEEVPSLIFKVSGTQIGGNLYNVNSKLTQDTEYIIRQEVTFLLNDNLAE